MTDLLPRRRLSRLAIAAVGSASIMALTVGCAQNSVSSSGPEPTNSTSVSAPATPPGTTLSPSTTASSTSPTPSSSATPSARSSAKPSAKPSAKASTPSAESGNFASAVKFAQALEKHDYAAAAKLTAPGSAAARYVSSAKALRQARKDNGEKLPGAGTAKADTGARTITLTGATESGSRWGGFSYDSKHRVRSWNTKAGSISKSLWSRSARTSGLGVTATLQSAYRAGDGDLYVVVAYQATRQVGFYYGGDYAGPDKYHQQSSKSSTVDSLKAKKSTLAYYVFKDAKFGGKLTVTATASNYTQTAALVLSVR